MEAAVVAAVVDAVRSGCGGRAVRSGCGGGAAVVEAVLLEAAVAAVVDVWKRLWWRAVRSGCSGSGCCGGGAVRSGCSGSGRCSGCGGRAVRSGCGGRAVRKRLWWRCC